MDFPSCVNCSIDFDSVDQKHFTLHIVLPPDLIPPLQNPQQQQQHQQVLQAVEIPVVDTLKEIYNLRSLDELEKPKVNNDTEDNSKEGQCQGQNQNQNQLQVPVCTNCANMLANLYLAHKTFGQQRQSNSFLNKHIEQSKKRKILIVKVSNTNVTPNANYSAPKAILKPVTSNVNVTLVKGQTNLVDLKGHQDQDQSLGQCQVQGQPIPLISLDDDDNVSAHVHDNDDMMTTPAIEINIEQEDEDEHAENENSPMIIPVGSSVETGSEIPMSIPMPLSSDSNNFEGDPNFSTESDLLCEVKVEEFEQEDFDTELGAEFQVPTSVYLPSSESPQVQSPQPNQQQQPTLVPLNPRVFTVAASSLRPVPDKNIIGSQKRIEPTSNLCLAQPLLIASINPTTIVHSRNPQPPVASTYKSTIPIQIPNVIHQAQTVINNGITSGTGTVIGTGPTSPPRINVLNLPSSESSALLLDESILGMNIGNFSKLKQIPLCRPGTSLEVSDPTRRMYIIPKGGPPFQCPDCPQMFALPAVYRNHILAHIKKQEENGLLCKMCPAFRFETLHDLIAHHKYNHQSNFVPQQSQGQKKNPTLKCEHPECNYVASSTADSLHHSVYKHSQFQSTTSGTPILRTRKEENDLIKLHLLRASMEIDILEEKFPLKQDDKPEPLNTSEDSQIKTFSIIFPDLTCHFSITDGPPYRCPFCSKPFNCIVNWQSLKKHITEIHLSFLSGRTYNCKKCGKEFEKSSGLRNHRRRCGKPEVKKVRPIQPKIFKCDRCPRKFSSEKNKQVHLSHCGMQSFPCQICGLVFTRNCKLVSHMYKHATARPFICDQCGRSYKNKHGLSFHQKISHTEEGRLKYNELMRNKNRQRKLRKNAMLANIRKAEGEQEGNSNEEQQDQDLDQDQEDADADPDADAEDLVEDEEEEDEEGEQDEEEEDEDEEEMELQGQVQEEGQDEYIVS